MSEFRLGVFPSSSVLYVYSMRAQIWTDPPYQRMSDVWPPEKRQLLLDSILNGYDIPKLYFHEFFPSKVVGSSTYKYAIVDGKQRLQSIFEFIDGRYALSKDLDYIHDPSRKLAGLTYAELAREHPDLKTKFDGFVLPIVTIQTADTELIEDMFSRLNEAVPLNAPEKRNAFGGPLPAIIRQTSKRKFFAAKIPFDNTRYRHLDLATKFLYVEQRDALSDTKKVYLDEFVRSYREEGIIAKAKQLGAACRSVVDQMADVFIDDDPLLRSVGTVVLYYFLFRDAMRNSWPSMPRRRELTAFENERRQNRELAEKDVTSAAYHLLEFDRLTQSPNDGVALRYRYAVLRNYVGPNKGRPEIPGSEDKKME